MKTGPSLRNQQFDVKGLKDLPQWEHDLKLSIEDDRSAMLPFLRKLAHFYARRYTMLGREVTQPWVGASDFILPLIDKYVTKLKVGYHSVIHGPERTVSMRVLDESAIKNRTSAELYLNSILQGQSPRYSMPDFTRQTLYHIDNMLNSGRGIMHGYWSKRTDTGMRQIKRKDLPAIIKSLLFAPDMTPEERVALQADAENRGQTLNGDAILAHFRDTINPVTTTIFDKHANQFKDILVRDMGFDEKDRLDRAAIAQLMRWLRGGLVDGRTAIHSRFVVEETPRLVDIPPENVIVPRRTPELCQARRLSIDQEFTDFDFQRMAIDYEWPEDAVNNVLDNGKQRREEQVIGRELGDARRWRNEHGTLGNAEQETIRLRKVYTWKDISGEGIPERVMYWYEPQTGERLSFQWFDGNQWPVADNHFEVNEPDYFSSRSLGEVIDDPDRYITAWHRHKHNNMTLQTTVGFFVERQSRWDPEANRFRPGFIMELDRIQDAREMQLPQTSIVIEREEQFLQLWVESHLGEVSNDLTADASLRNPRTATDIMQRESQRQRVLGARVRAFNAGMQRAYQMVWELAQKHAPPNFAVQLVGLDPSTLTREDIKGNFMVYPVGSVEDMDPEFRRQQAIRRFTFMSQFNQSDPNQILYDMNTALAGKLVMDEFGLQESRLLMRERNQDEIKDIVQQRQQMAQQLAQFEESAQRALANAGNTPAEIRALMQEMRSTMPHKGLQNIIQRGQQAEASAIDAQQQATTSAAFQQALGAENSV